MAGRRLSPVRWPLILLLPVLICVAGCDSSQAEKREQPSKDSVAPALKAPVISEQFTLLPCPAEPKSTLDFEGCAEHRIVRSDRAINETVRAIYDQLSSSRDAADRFVRGEHAWLTYRRAVCESRADLYEGGSAAAIVFADCVAERNADHLNDVRAFERHLWMGKAIYVPGSFGLGGYGLRYKPTMLVFTGNGSSYVDQLRYLTYGGPRASAVGIDQVNDCEPSCGGGTYHPVRARVTFWQRTTCRGKRIYAMFKIDAPGARRYGKTNPFTVDLRYMAACPTQTRR